MTAPIRARRLQPGRHVDGVADHRVLVAHPAGEHLAGVDAHPQRQLDVPRRRPGADLGVDLAHRRLHRKARPAPPARGRPRGRPGRRRRPSRCRRCTCRRGPRARSPPGSAARGRHRPAPSCPRDRGARRSPCSRTDRRTAPSPGVAPRSAPAPSRRAWRRRRLLARCLGRTESGSRTHRRIGHPVRWAGRSWGRRSPDRRRSARRISSQPGSQHHIYGIAERSLQAEYAPVRHLRRFPRRRTCQSEPCAGPAPSRAGSRPMIEPP